jgi:hypothetical protein
MIVKTWRLIGKDGRPYTSMKPGVLGGHRMGRLYGLLTCRNARQAIERGGYVRHRVFFLNEDTARAAGYRPCAACMPEKYSQWRDARLLKAHPNRTNEALER